MCDCCKAHEIDSVNMNGNDTTFACCIYNAFGYAKDISVSLCRVHSIELFQVGESRFISEYGDFRKRPDRVFNPFSATFMREAKNIELVIE